MRSTLAVTAMVLSLLPTSFSAAGFIGVSWGGDVYSINEVTGSGSLIGASGWSELNSMAMDRSGRFLSATRGASSRIVELDPITGNGTLFHAPFLSDIRSMAYSPDGVLYAIQDIGGVQSHLYMLDLSVPFGDQNVATFIGQSTIGGIQGLTFAPDGTLYGYSTSSGLITMNPDTAEATDVNGKIDGLPGIQTLAFAPDGTLYGVHDALYTLDITTGERTPYPQNTRSNRNCIRLSKLTTVCSKEIGPIRYRVWACCSDSSFSSWRWRVASTGTTS